MNSTPSSDPMTAAAKVPLFTIAREWTRLGCVGFSGPPAHIALLRRLCVEDRKWIEPSEFEDAIASVNLLPGPASTQLAIFCAWRLRKTVGALLGGICFIAPGLVLILVLSALFWRSILRAGYWVQQRVEAPLFPRSRFMQQRGSYRQVGGASEP